MNTIPVTFQAAIEPDAPELLVIGGGPAGFPAAVCAARRGIRTMIAERNGALGGMAAAGLVGPFMTCSSPDGKRQLIRGFFEEFVRRMERAGGAIHPMRCRAGSSYAGYRVAGHSNVTPFNPEIFKREAEACCLEHNVKLLYHAVCVGVARSGDGRRLTGAWLAVKGGIRFIPAQFIIDATGDADVAAAAGVPTVKDAEPQPASLFFTIDGVDRARFDRMLNDDGPNRLCFEAEVAAARERGEFPIPRRYVALYESSDGTFRVNMSRLLNVDGTDPAQVTAAEIEGRRQIEIILNFLRKRIPGCGNIRLLTSACDLGVRESRRIVGDFVFTEESIRSGERPADTIALCSNSIDCHFGNDVRYEPAGEPYGLPYRMLQPHGVDNLLVAGRCVSCSHLAQAAIRVMPPCFAMGQAAGNAAALAIRDECAASGVDISRLRENLAGEDVPLE